MYAESPDMVYFVCGKGESGVCQKNNENGALVGYKYSWLPVCFLPSLNQTSMLYLSLIITTAVVVFLGQCWSWLSKSSVAINKIARFQTAAFQNTPETNNPVWLPIQGALPSWLNGILYRVGKRDG